MVRAAEGLLAIAVLVFLGLAVAPIAWLRRPCCEGGKPCPWRAKWAVSTAGMLAIFAIHARSLGWDIPTVLANIGAIGGSVWTWMETTSGTMFGFALGAFLGTMMALVFVAAWLARQWGR